MSIFHPLGVVSRGSETQLQVDENLNKLTQQDKGERECRLEPDLSVLNSSTLDRVNIVQEGRQIETLPDHQTHAITVFYHNRANNPSKLRYSI